MAIASVELVVGAWLFKQASFSTETSKTATQASAIGFDKLPINPILLSRGIEIKGRSFKISSVVPDLLIKTIASVERTRPKSP